MYGSYHSAKWRLKVKAVFRLGQFGAHFGPDQTWIPSGSDPDQVRIIAGSLGFRPDHRGFGTAIPRVLPGELTPFKKENSKRTFDPAPQRTLPSARCPFRRTLDRALLNLLEFYRGFA